MASDDGKGFFEGWSEGAKFMLALAAMIFIGSLWVAPALTVWNSISAQTSSPSAQTSSPSAQTSSPVDYGPMVSVYSAMTTVAITGIFLFMTLRIDRGTRLKAERVAKKTMTKVVDEIVAEETNEMNKIVADGKARMDEIVAGGKEKMDNAVADGKGKMDEAMAQEREKVNNFTQQMQGALTDFGSRSQETLESAGNRLREKYEKETTPEAIREVIGSRITEEELRKHIEAILMVTANGEIVKGYAAERAEQLNAKTIKQLIRVLKETLDLFSQASEGKRGFWARLFRRGKRSAG